MPTLVGWLEGFPSREPVVDKLTKFVAAVSAQTLILGTHKTTDRDPQTMPPAEWLFWRFGVEPEM